MIDSEMFTVADINQAVITAPAVAVDDGLGGHTSANNGLQSGFLAVRHDLRIDTAITFEDAEDNRLATGPATTLATNSPSAEVRFIHFDFTRRERRGTFTFFGDAFSDFEKDHVDALARQSGQMRGFAGRQIEREVAQHSQDFTSVILEHR